MAAPEAWYGDAARQAAGPARARRAGTIPRMDDTPTTRWWIPPALLLMGVLGGAVVGLGMNRVNVRVSPSYFAIVLGIPDTQVRTAATVHGLIEGGLLGGFFGVAAGVAFAASTRLRAPAALAVRAWVAAAVVAILCWAFGGACGWAWAAGSPESFSGAFRMAPFDDRTPGFGWVGGSIWGAYAGAVLGAVAACVYIHLAWRRTFDGAPRFEVLPPARLDVTSNPGPDC